MNSLVEKLKLYFAETSRDKVLEDWTKTETFDQVGLTMDEFLVQTSWNFKIKTDDPITGCNRIVNNYSPEFSSDCFY